MTIAAPTLIGDLPTASKQALLYSSALASPSPDPTIAYDMVQLATHAQAWLVLLNSDGTMTPVPTKLAGYNCPIENYPRFRRAMNGSSAARLLAKWAAPATPTDPAFLAVRQFCAQHGVTPREEFRVLVAKNVAPVSSQPPASDRNRVVADLIVAVLPYLNAEERARIADAARH